MESKQLLKRTILVGLFLIPFVPFLVSSSLFFPFITTKAFTWRIIVEIIFAAWLILAVVDTDYRPRKSLILYAVLSFLVVIGLADLFGVAPLKSFWSNFERMEGFITLLHLGMFFLVISSVFKEADWKKWWNASLAASFLMVIYCVLQLTGLKTINQGGVRVDGTLGNAIYLAVYMLFHIFIAMLFMWREWINTTLRWVYGLLILSQMFILYHTATRGAILGLIGGILVVALLSIWNREDRLVRRMGIVTVVGLVVLISGFVMFKDQAFIQNSPVLSRFSSLDTTEIKTQGRYFVWPMAWEGVKDRPILGWGQENFSYVFQKYYSADMYHLEPWFDRAHNTFLDWAVAGGLLGLAAYLALYLALLYLIWEGGQFSYTEKSILSGLIAAYFFHNLFVFDHLVSYVLFFSLLAYVHHRNNSEIIFLNNKSTAENKSKSIAIPIVMVLLTLTLYFVNVKPIRTNIVLIQALKSLQTPGAVAQGIQYFEKAHETSRLGRPEVVEQLSSNTATILSSDLSVEEKNTFYSFAKEAVIDQTEEYSNEDARYELITGSFLLTTGILDEALVYLNHARELMPGKQQIYFEIGTVEINQGNLDQALKTFKTAYDLAPGYTNAGIIYLIGAIYAGDSAVESELISKIPERELVFSDIVINAYYSNNRIDRVRSLLQDRIKLDPSNTDTYKKYLDDLAI